MQSISVKDYWKLIKKGNKHHAKKVVLDGITFDSGAEAELYKMLKADKNTLHLDVHVPVTLPGGVRWKVDFMRYFKKDGKGEFAVEPIECKGKSTRDFEITRKIFDEFHPLRPLQVYRKKGARWEIL